MQAWRVHRHGRPSDVLVLDEMEPAVPGPGEVRVRVDATTLNFNDIDGIYGRYRTVCTATARTHRAWKYSATSTRAATAPNHGWAEESSRRRPARTAVTRSP